jgi:branched-chain amino acid transport system permease protein
MIAGFVILAVMSFFGVEVVPAFLITIPIFLFVFGFLFKRVLVQPLIKYGDLPLVVATIGLAILLKEGAKIIWGGNALPFPEVVPDQILRFAGIRVSLTDLVTIAIAVSIIIGLQWFLSSTLVGRSMQATAQNSNVAQILGVNVNRMVLYTFLINAALVTVAALLITPSYFAKFNNGETLGLGAFMAAIIGGFNQVRGAIIGGFLIGIIENLGAFYISSEYRAAFPLILFVLVIVFKPEGLFGRKEERTI